MHSKHTTQYHRCILDFKRNTALQPSQHAQHHIILIKEKVRGITTSNRAMPNCPVQQGGITIGEGTRCRRVYRPQEASPKPKSQYVPWWMTNVDNRMKRIPGAHISGTYCRRSLTQGNRLRESKDQLHEAIQQIIKQAMAVILPYLTQHRVHELVSA